MKIRTDFVTNSSSSSFIIAIGKDLEKAKEIYDSLVYAIENSESCDTELGDTYESLDEAKADNVFDWSSERNFVDSLKGDSYIITGDISYHDEELSDKFDELPDEVKIKYWD